MGVNTKRIDKFGGSKNVDHGSTIAKPNASHVIGDLSARFANRLS
jgi:hypothetical protein